MTQRTLKQIAKEAIELARAGKHGHALKLLEPHTGHPRVKDLYDRIEAQKSVKTNETPAGWQGFLLNLIKLLLLTTFFTVGCGAICGIFTAFSATNETVNGGSPGFVDIIGGMLVGSVMSLPFLVVLICPLAIVIYLILAFFQSLLSR